MNYPINPFDPFDPEFIPAAQELAKQLGKILKPEPTQTEVKTMSKSAQFKISSGMMIRAVENWENQTVGGVLYTTRAFCDQTAKTIEGLELDVAAKSATIDNLQAELGKVSATNAEKIGGRGDLLQFEMVSREKDALQGQLTSEKTTNELLRRTNDALARQVQEWKEDAAKCDAQADKLATELCSLRGLCERILGEAKDARLTNRLIDGFREELAGKGLQAPWSGEGLPPAGADCEYLGAHQYDVWTTVKIMARWGGYAFVDYGGGWRAERNPSRFRPLRTPEQIAAEERKTAIQAIVKVLQQECCAGDDDGSISAEALYNAGYRKHAE